MAKIIGEGLTHIPWQDKPAASTAPVWRYSENPVIKRNPIPDVARIFNSAVISVNDKFIGVFRGETTTGVPHLYIGYSSDALHWEYNQRPIVIEDENGCDVTPASAYDPRLIKLEDAYYIIWCTDFYGASLGIARTTDFKRFVSYDNPFLPFNRNGVLFPRKVNDKYLMLTRPSDSGHTPFGDIFLSESPDMYYWGKHRRVMGKVNSIWWESVKIGAGCAPIETDEGWLLFYHGVTGTCNGFIYSMGAAILDIENPSIVKYRCENFVLTPEEWYEERGFVANVVFPCAALVDAPSGKIAIYYGAADTYTCLAFTTADDIISYIKTHHKAIDGDSDIGR